MKIKTVKILYWVFTILFAVMMMFSAIPNLMMEPENVEFISGFLKYPEYLIPFLGAAKALASIGIVIPGFPRLKEWCYAGLFFDLAGATYSVVAVSGFELSTMVMLIFIIPGVLSYIFFRKLQQAKTATAS